MAVKVNETVRLDAPTKADSEFPLVFSCAKCRQIVGDSHSWVCANDELRTISLKCVTDKVQRGRSLVASTGSLDIGSAYLPLMCVGCDTEIGKVYHTTSKKLDEIRDLFTLDIQKVDSYQVGSMIQVDLQSELESYPSTIHLNNQLKKVLQTIVALNHRLQKLESSAPGSCEKCPPPLQPASAADVSLDVCQLSPIAPTQQQQRQHIVTVAGSSGGGRGGGVGDGVAGTERICSSTSVTLDEISRAVNTKHDNGFKAAAVDIFNNSVAAESVVTRAPSSHDGFLAVNLQQGPPPVSRKTAIDSSPLVQHSIASPGRLHQGAPLQPVNSKRRSIASSSSSYYTTGKRGKYA